MCKSEAQGGQLCPEHTREPYRLALTLRLQKGKPSALFSKDSLLEHATRYATTSEGESRIKLDITKNSSQKDIVSTLESALVKAKRIREVNAETSRFLKKASAQIDSRKSLDGSAPEPISWLVDEPIWPNRDSTDRATAGLGKNKEEMLIVQKAFRALYRDAWRALFLKTGQGSQPPKSNQEGWAWRKEATEFAASRIAKAKVISAGEVKVGMTVYNGAGIYTVKDVTLVNLDPRGKKINAYRFTYHGFKGKEEDSSSERKFVLLVPGKSFAVPLRS